MMSDRRIGDGSTMRPALAFIGVLLYFPSKKKNMNLCGNLFRRKTFKPQPKQLRIDGVKTVLTAAADDAELAAHALLESRIYGDKQQRRAAKQNGDQTRDAAYYQQVSDRVKEGREAEARSAMRFVAYCEQELENKHTDTRELELGLYKFQNIVEREGGELLKRWQHCLARCIVIETKSASAHGPTDDERVPGQTTHPDLSEPLG